MRLSLPRPEPAVGEITSRCACSYESLIPSSEDEREMIEVLSTLRLQMLAGLWALGINNFLEAKDSFPRHRCPSDFKLLAGRSDDATPQDFESGHWWSMADSFAVRQFFRNKESPPPGLVLTSMPTTWNQSRWWAFPGLRPGTGVWDLHDQPEHHQLQPSPCCKRSLGRTRRARAYPPGGRSVSPIQWLVPQ